MLMLSRRWPPRWRDCHHVLPCCSWPRSLALAVVLLSCNLASAVDVFELAVCGGFTDSGDPCCWMEALGMEIAKLAWDRGAFSNLTHIGVLELPPEGKQDFTVAMKISDVEGDAGTSVMCAINEWGGSNKLPLVVAAGWSSLTVPVATVGPAVHGVQIDWSSTSPRLSDKKIFKYYSRIAPSDNIVAELLAVLLSQSWNYNRLLLVYEKGDYGGPLFDAFAAQLDVGVALEVVATPEKPVDADKVPMQELFEKASKRLMRIGVLFAVKTMTYEVLSIMPRLLRPGNLWMGVSDFLSSWANLPLASQLSFLGCMTLGVDSRASEERITAFKAFVRTLGLDDLHTSTMKVVLPCNNTPLLNLGKVVPGTSPGCWWNGMSVFQNPQDIIDDYTLWAFDALALVHYSVNKLLANGFTMAQIKDTTLLSSIRSANFSGLTGDVRFDANGDRIPGRFVIKNTVRASVNSLEARSVGFFNPIQKTITWTEAPTYSDGSNVRPDASFPQCPLGHIRNASDFLCAACPQGTYADNADLADCKDCPSGTFGSGVAAKDATDCTSCPAGKYTEAKKGRLNISHCVDCPGGRALKLPFGKDDCELCAPGTFATEGQEECARCDIGRYQSSQNQTSCLSCESVLLGSTTPFLAATEMSNCVCSEKWYRPLENSSCLQCPEGMSCALGSDMRAFLNAKSPGSASTQASAYPLLKPGYWSSLDDPLSIFRCQNTDYCPGGSPETCVANAKDRACAQCDADYYPTGISCEKCTSFETSVLLFPLLPLLISPLIIGFWYWVVAELPRDWGSWLNGVGAITFITLNFYQMVAMAKSANILPPELVEGSLSGAGVSQDVVSIFRIACLGYADMASRITMQSLIPFVVFVLCFVTYFLSRLVAQVFGLDCAMDFDFTINVFGSIILVFFLGIVSLSLSLFKCQANPNSKWTLVSDFSVVCYEGGDWNSMLGIAVACVLVYCVGSVCTFAYQIYVAPQMFHFEYFQKRWKFLFAKYRNDVHWWSLVVLAKGIALNLGIVFCSNAVSQLYWMIICLMVYVACVIKFPWRHHQANRMDIITQQCAIAAISTLTFFAIESSHLRGDMTNLSFTLILLPILFMGVFSLIFFMRSFPQYSYPNPKQMDAIMDMVDLSLQVTYTAKMQDIREFCLNLPDADRYAFIQTFTMLHAEIDGKARTRLVSQKSSYLSGSNSSSFNSSSHLSGDGNDAKESASTTVNEMGLRSESIPLETIIEASSIASASRSVHDYVSERSSKGYYSSDVDTRGISHVPVEDTLNDYRVQGMLVQHAVGFPRSVPAGVTIPRTPRSPSPRTPRMPQYGSPEMPRLLFDAHTPRAG